MSTMLLTQSHQEVTDWLRAQAESLGLRVTLLTDEATMRGGWLYLPTHIDGVADAYDDALKLQQLEDAWNDRDPQPDPPLFLFPVKDPARRAAWERAARAMDQKIKAVDAFGTATSLEEQAAAEFQRAK